MATYHPEPYWSEVARRIGERGDHNVIAGDDEPFYRYKRRKFLEMLRAVPFTGKTVLEIGCGPGGNLRAIHDLGPASLTGVDISADMIALANKNLPPETAQLIKTDGTTLPFADASFDVVFSATVLQHNTDDRMMRALAGEMCRVSSDRVILFERIDRTIRGDALCLGRPVEYYAGILAEHEFALKDIRFINIHVSYLVCGAIRKGLNPGSRKEGEPLNKASILLQNALLPLTRVLDRVLPVSRDLAKLEFSRE